MVNLFEKSSQGVVGDQTMGLHEGQAFAGVVAQKLREIQAAKLNAVQMAKGFQAAVESGNEAEELAWVEAITALNRQEDVAHYLGEQEKRGLVADGRRGSFTLQGWQSFLRQEYFGGSGGGRKAQRADELMAHLAVYAESIGRPRGFGAGGYDAVTGLPKDLTNVDEMVAEIWTKISRNDAEQMGGALEPAMFREQFSSPLAADTEIGADPAAGVNSQIRLGKESNLGAFTELGSKLLSRITPSLCVVLYKTRKLQDRIFRIAGIEPSLGGGVNSDSIDYGKLVDTWVINPHFVEVLLARSGLSTEELASVLQRFNKELKDRSLPEADFSGSVYSETAQAGRKVKGG
jgi:hypothetical protein